MVNRQTISKNAVVDRVRATGAADEAITRWMGKPLIGIGDRTPIELIDAGRGDLVLSAIESMTEGVYS